MNVFHDWNLDPAASPLAVRPAPRLVDHTLSCARLTPALELPGAEQQLALLAALRRLGLKHLIDTQRYADAPDIMRSEGTHLALFRTTRYRDRETLAHETDPEVSEIARGLDVGECVLVDL